jgi:hypothetical protein
MTLETYENLLRVLQKRVRQGRVTGNWKAVSVATTEIHNLMNDWNQESSPPTRLVMRPSMLAGLDGQPHNQ